MFRRKAQQEASYARQCTALIKQRLDAFKTIDTPYLHVGTRDLAEHGFHITKPLAWEDVCQETSHHRVFFAPLTAESFDDLVKEAKTTNSRSSLASMSRDLTEQEIRAAFHGTTFEKSIVLERYFAQLLGLQFAKGTLLSHSSWAERWERSFASFENASRLTASVQWRTNMILLASNVPMSHADSLLVEERDGVKRRIVSLQSNERCSGKTRVAVSDPKHRSHSMCTLLESRSGRDDQLFTSELVTALHMMSLYMGQPDNLRFAIFPILILSFSGFRVRLVQVHLDPMSETFKISMTPYKDIIIGKHGIADTTIVLRWMMGRPCGAVSHQDLRILPDQR